jgi:predicted RNA binding protein YcfA (HicA-like mRNA interferase family)
VPAFKPIKRSELVSYLKKSGYDGPFAGGKHQFMIKGDHSITLPNPHRSEIGREFLKKILREAKISIEEWEKL